MLLRPSVIALIGLTAAAAAVLGLSLDRDEPGDLPPPTAVGPLPSPPPAAAFRSPVVDVLRIGAGGDVMIAGRAHPGASVRLHDAGRAGDLGRAVADVHGEWVVVPTLPPGTGTHLLAPVEAEGGQEIEGDPVLVVVPAPGEGDAMATTLPARGGSRVLQPLPAAGAAEALEIRSVDRDGDDRLTVGGRAEAGATVHVYLDNRFVGRSRAGDDGLWRLTARAPHHGDHALRADQVNAKGKVMRRAECDWDAGDDMVPAREEFSAKRQGAVWRIARRIEGGGTLYTVVYPEAAEPVPDPDLLYPGQVVSTPRP